jgi:hypothetical protein
MVASRSPKSWEFVQLEYGMLAVGVIGNTWEFDSQTIGSCPIQPVIYQEFSWYKE